LVTPYPVVAQECSHSFKQTGLATTPAKGGHVVNDDVAVVFH
jgi:hypothetical protein